MTHEFPKTPFYIILYITITKLFLKCIIHTKNICKLLPSKNKNKINIVLPFLCDPRFATFYLHFDKFANFGILFVFAASKTSRII